MNPYALKAFSLLQTIQGKPQSLEERIELSIAVAADLLQASLETQTASEQNQQAELAKMVNDPVGKAFTTAITDQCFRSKSASRAANQLVYLIGKYGVPASLSGSKKWALKVFKNFGNTLSYLLVPLLNRLIRKETARVILPGEEGALHAHLRKRKEEGVRVNLNHLGEAILSEEEAERRLDLYLEDLDNPLVECISVKISTLYSQINVLAVDSTLESLAVRLRKLYRAAKLTSKFVNLDMEEFRDLNLTVALFRNLLDEPEFYQLKAGIVLQSYLPESFLIQQELTLWAIQRVASGGAPIKIRLVKGANLAMEQVEASLRDWSQAPYKTKAEVDANYKRMVAYACQKEHAKAVHIGMGTHNVFDIAYGLVLRAENGVEEQVSFEMLEGMSEPMRRIVQSIAGSMLLYCPVAKKEEFQNAVAYLVRRLDENTAPENYLRAAFHLRPGTPEWEEQAASFAASVREQGDISFTPRRTQNRLKESFAGENKFKNCPDTDWSLPCNRKWAEEILKEWKDKVHEAIPLVIQGNREVSSKKGEGRDPSSPEKTLYEYALASEEQVQRALKEAKDAFKGQTVEERYSLLGKIAKSLRHHRGDLIGAMVADTGKTVPEADIEVSEAIDFAEYYRKNLKEWSELEGIEWKSKGPVLVAPPWNFPCSIPSGGILAALAAGNTVLFKPAPEAILVGWQLANAFWEAGVSLHALQFIACEDDPVGSRLIQDPALAVVVLTGSTDTAKYFLKLKPGLDLVAETGGKNTMVISSLADRDLAIKDLLHSAFSHAGQKCSACSLAILEAEVYDDPHFLRQLKEAAASLVAGSPWNLQTKINPLIRPAEGALLRGLTCLEEGESWLLKPKQDLSNPQLWSPGIKLGVRPGSFTYTTELFGPVLGLVRAASFDDALKIMNQTPYGLTAGLHSLDEREHERWLATIEAGNCYINRTMTGAIVQRQPFGGCKESSFGRGFKAGGPNYLLHFMRPIEKKLSQTMGEWSESLKAFDASIRPLLLEHAVWEASLHSYAYHWLHYFSKKHDPSQVLGQDNWQFYVPRKAWLKLRPEDHLIDILRVIASAIVCHAPLAVSVAEEQTFNQLSQTCFPAFVALHFEPDQAFLERVEKGEIERIRFLGTANPVMQEKLARQACRVDIAGVVANGRIELLHVLREAALSRDYHRYGNISIR